MKEEQPNKLRRMKRQEPSIDSLDLLYASIGYLGVLYESQLVFLKHEMEKPESSDQDDHLIKSLQATHVLAVDLVSRFFARQPLDVNDLQNLHQTTVQAMKQLALEGKRFVDFIEDGRSDR
jgi:hypothetical protein